MGSLKNQIFKYLYLFYFGGTTYVTMEVFFRGYSHWSMFLLAGIVFILIGLLNELWEWTDSILEQIITGTLIATIAEYITGYIVNIKLGWNIWDYSNMWGNINGQICPAFILLWVPISLLAIVLDDIIRWKFFDEEKPHYKI